MASEPTSPMMVPLAAEDSHRDDDDRALIGELVQDAWVHPLAGPTRRMPRNHTGAFGAERPGERPPECVSGHCGVDLGNEWGEPVHAVHDGVVDFVQRGPNEDRGGIFVRIGHRGGTLYSWYFHLAAVPRWIRPGVQVAAGQVIGLLGDTGIKHSRPHLHFALSVKPSKTARERYLDPEPLIALWPLWIPGENGRRGRLATEAEPGVPVRAPGRRRAKPKRADPPASDSPPAAAEASPPELIPPS
jgi:murein DD-endopeptidase MepM/ murein hydrolase activator NlpD